MNKERFANQMEEHLNRFSFMRGRGTGCSTVDNPKGFKIGDQVKTIDNTISTIKLISGSMATLSNGRRIPLKRLIGNV